MYAPQERAFFIAAPRTWNRLPRELRQLHFTPSLRPAQAKDISIHHSLSSGNCEQTYYVKRARSTAGGTLEMLFVLYCMAHWHKITDITVVL